MTELAQNGIHSSQSVEFGVVWRFEQFGVVEGAGGVSALEKPVALPNEATVFEENDHVADNSVQTYLVEVRSEIQQIQEFYSNR